MDRILVRLCWIWARMLAMGADVRFPLRTDRSPAQRCHSDGEGNRSQHPCRRRPIGSTTCRTSGRSKSFSILVAISRANGGPVPSPSKQPRSLLVSGGVEEFEAGMENLTDHIGFVISLRAERRQSPHHRLCLWDANGLACREFQVRKSRKSDRRRGQVRRHHSHRASR